MDDKRLIEFIAFNSRLDDEMKIAQEECESITRFFQEPRHIEQIRGTLEDDENDKKSWKNHGKERMKTVSVAIILCLHIGIDPPETPPRTDPCARKLAWVDPHQCGSGKASQKIAGALRTNYERWQPRAKYKIACDPPLDDVRKITTNLRRVSGGDRILFHYNGHGVPRPTDNGEIWVFNKSFTQYIPLSIYDLQGWIEAPAVYVWECHSAETIIKSFQRFANDHESTWQQSFDTWQENNKDLPIISSRMSEAEKASRTGFPEPYPGGLQDCIHLAACRAGEFLPMSDPNLPADLFTSCLTTPVQTAILWYLIKTGKRKSFPENVLDLIPGQLGERRTVLGELNWIFTAITDTIAFTSIDREVFQRLFRQDLLLASLFRSFLLAQRVMSDSDVLPVSWPHIKNTSQHELWSCWDSTLDMVIDYVWELIYIRNTAAVINAGREILLRSEFFPFLTLIDFGAYVDTNDNASNRFFVEQLMAFELWLDYGIDKGKPPLQLPVVLQVLLSQTHRVRALKLLARFLDFGRWAVGYSLSVGIFPYVLRLLQSNTREMRPWLAFIWAKILAVDPTCQIELFKENGDDSGGAGIAGPSPQPKSQPQSQSATPPQPPQKYMQAAVILPGETVPQQSQQQNQQQQQQIQQQQKKSSTQNNQNQNQNQNQAQVQSSRDQKSGKKKEGQLRYVYFTTILNDPDTSPKQKIVPAFVLAMLTHNNYKKAQEHLTEKDFVNLCTELLFDAEASKCRLLKLWLLIGLGRLWSDHDAARWQAVRLVSYDKVVQELEDTAPEVRAAAVFALGSLLKNSSQLNEHAAAIDEHLVDELCNRCVFDGSVIVREELIVALQWFVFDFERRFVKLLYELITPCKITIPHRDDSNEKEEGYDISSKMVSKGKKRELGDPHDSSINRKRISTSVFHNALEEDVINDAEGNVTTIAHVAGTIERDSEDLEFRKRALAQIKHLEAKTFNEPFARTWLALLRLSLDPVEGVARMAQRIVLHVEAGIHEMEMSLQNKLSQLNQKIAIGHSARKTSRVTVSSPIPPQQSSSSQQKTAGGMSELAATIQKNLMEEKLRDKERENRVTFMVGSPAVNDGNVFGAANSHSILSPTISPSNTSKSSEKPINVPAKVDFTITNSNLDETSTESRSEIINRRDFTDVLSKSFTPKRNTQWNKNFSKQEDSKTLRKVIENPIVSTQFVQWCSRIFVEPILPLLEDPNQNEILNDDSILTKTSLTDWALHALEGMRQSADIETANFQSTKYDTCLWRVGLTHSIHSLVTSKLRRCMYASDGRTVTIIRQDVDNRAFRKFDLTGSNPFNQENVSQLILINEMSREMLLTCSRNGIVRIWDPCFTPWSEEYEKLPEMLSASFPLSDQMKLSDETNRCLFDWNQKTGRVFCTGPKSIRVWDAHYEKNVQDIGYGWVTNSAGTKKSGKNGRNDRNWVPTAISVETEGNGNLVAIGNSDGFINVIDMRTPKRPILQAKPPSTSYAPSIMSLTLRKREMENDVLFAGNRDGLIAKWDVRMFEEPTATIETPWPTGSHSQMFVHNDSHLMASASGSKLLLYDMTSCRQIANILPNQPVFEPNSNFSSLESNVSPTQQSIQRNQSAFGFLRLDNSRRSSSHQQIEQRREREMRNITVEPPHVTALTMHQMRSMTVVGYDDNSVCVYGSQKPGLSANYENSKV
ncbi:unnamed protein product [Caenorhabditis angaria]|uniref:Raptor N-terminal CASPase-like domain-containing protein n=1 Tax=Caenorhabditis angaria TaxID=860376 RepID=A0A9P1N1U3_9PELO|nr:unnamed protein product [Caenorhabditis angaria]